MANWVGERDVNADTLNMISLYVTFAAITFAVIVAFFAMRAGSGDRDAAAKWRARAKNLDGKMNRAHAVFGAYPGLILVWEEAMPTQIQESLTDWGAPTVYGSTAALASLVRFAEPGKPKEFAQRVLDGLADYNTLSQGNNDKTLRQFINELRQKGEAFSTTISMPGGKLIEADGSVAGAQVVVWLEDASIRGRDEKDAITKFEQEKLTTLSDPIAFIDIMGKAPFPMWRLSGTGRIVWVNDTYIRAVGGENLPHVLSAQIQLDKACAAQAQKVLSENILVKDARAIVMEGKRKPTLLTMFPVSGGVAGLAVDASEAEQLRIALKRHIRAHDETLNNMGEAVVIFGADQKMNFHNHAFSKMFSLEENWFKDRPCPRGMA